MSIIWLFINLANHSSLPDALIVAGGDVAKGGAEVVRPRWGFRVPAGRRPAVPKVSPCPLPVISLVAPPNYCSAISRCLLPSLPTPQSGITPTLQWLTCGVLAGRWD